MTMPETPHTGVSLPRVAQPGAPVVHEASSHWPGDAAASNAQAAATAVMAAAEVPFDPSRRVSDAVVAVHLGAAKTSFDAAASDLAAAAERRRQAAEALTHVPHAPSLFHVLLTSAVGLFGVALVGLTISQLLPESIDLFIKRPYFLETLGRGALGASAWEAQRLAALVAGTIAVVPMLMVLVSRRRLHWGSKLALVAFELLFAAAFGVIRIGDAHVTPQMVAYSLFELALAGIGVLLCLAVAERLHADAERRQARKDARQKLAAATRWYEASTLGVSTALAAMEKVADDIRRREHDEFHRPLLAQVAAAHATTRQIHAAAHPMLRLVREQEARHG